MTQSTSKNKGLISIIIFLLLTNIAVLVFFLYFKDNKRNFHGGENSITNALQKNVGFNEDQMNKFQDLKKEHMQKIKPLFDSIRTAKDNLYNLLYTNGDVVDSVINSRAALIGERQKALDIQMLKNLKTIRALCTPDQQPKFDSAFKGIVSRMTGRFRKGNENNREKK